MHHVYLAQEHFWGKIILKLQPQVTFFWFLPVFLLPTILQTTATNFPEMISKFCSKTSVENLSVKRIKKTGKKLEKKCISYTLRSFGKSPFLGIRERKLGIDDLHKHW